MISISQIVMDVFSLAIRQAFPEVEDPPVLIQKGKFADYQCNSALTLCQVIVWALQQRTLSCTAYFGFFSQQQYSD